MGKRLVTDHLQRLMMATGASIYPGEENENWGAWGHHLEGPAYTQEAYVVLMEKGQIADDADPDKQRGGAQENAADVVARQVLGTGAVSTPPDLALPRAWGPRQVRKGCGGQDDGPVPGTRQQGPWQDLPWLRCQSS